VKPIVWVVFLLGLVGCQLGAKRDLSKNAVLGKAVFAEEKCFQCHTMPMSQIGRKYGDDWHYAHLWDPRLVVPSSAMPGYPNEFFLIKVVVGSKTYMTPSGGSAYGINRTPNLESLFSFNPSKFIYLYVSDVSWKTLPNGLKAFLPMSLSPETKKDGTPVVWARGSLQGRVNPGDQITLIAPQAPLEESVAFLQGQETAEKPDWFDIVDSKSKVVSGASIKLGKKVYEENCAVCHGTRGIGDGPASLFLYPKPRNLVSGEYKFKTTLSDESPTDADLYRTVTRGMANTAMPGRSSLPTRARWSVIAYIKSLARDRAKRPPRHLLVIHEPELAPSTLAEHRDRGEALFVGKAKCNDCHGPGGQSQDKLPHGDGPSALILQDDWGYPIHPADLAGGILKRGNSPKEIYITITTGMMGTPMPPYSDTLTDEERWDIAYYVSHLNQTHGK